MSEIDNLLEIYGLSKQFGGVRALNDVSFDIPKNEIIGLLGENGAGKSTLIKVVSGAHPSTTGTLLWEGQEITLKSPLDAQARGIVTIYQEFNLVPSLSIAENIFLGRQPRNRAGLVDWERMRVEAAAVMNRIGLTVRPTTTVSGLSIAQQQLVEIARALDRRAVDHYGRTDCRVVASGGDATDRDHAQPS